MLSVPTNIERRSTIPNYDFKCRECEHEFEKNVPMSERDEQRCECGGEAFRRITFYGSVWAPTASGATHK